MGGIQDLNENKSQSFSAFFNAVNVIKHLFRVAGCAARGASYVLHGGIDSNRPRTRPRKPLVRETFSCSKSRTKTIQKSRFSKHVTRNTRNAHPVTRNPGDDVFSIERFNDQYATDSTEIIVADRIFRILVPANLDDFINPSDVLNNFPLWAKVWKASWILAGFLAQMPVDTDRQILEIGGGLGLVSIAGCAFGHQMTMADYNQDALQFAQANAQLNNCAHLPVVQLDWNRPNLAGNFDLIVASEVVYRENDFAPLLKLFQTCLNPDGEIILASEMRKISKAFYKFMRSFYEVKTAKRVLRSENEENLITLFKLKTKD